MYTSSRCVLAAGAVLLSAGIAQAATLIGLTADNHIVRIDGDTRRAGAPVPVRGASGNLLGIDVRPADGKVYGVTDADQIVTIDPITGQAMQVSRLSERFASGGRATVDFNPVADRLRLMGMNGTNYRINVETGMVTVDGALKYQAGTPLAETKPRIVAGAYTNSVKGAQATQLFTVDSLLRQLNLQAPPNDGVQQAKGEIAASLPPGVAFDIVAGAQGGNTAYALAAGTLHTLSLENGMATPAGAVTNMPTSEIIDIAVMP
jgi:hypothetical protein